MLTREHAIAELKFRTHMVEPDRLLSGTHGHYIGYAKEMLRIYREAVGRRRRDIHRDIELIFADDPFYHPRRVESFCKLLDDESAYDRDSDRNCAKLRGEVFLAAGAKHPLSTQAEGLFDHAEQKVKAEIADASQRPWQDIEDQLFDDVLEFNRLKAFDIAAFPDARTLLARYNVAQFQVALFDATQMRVHATTHLKAILRFAKLAELMHTIRRNEDGSFLIILDGPASVLEETRRYGTCMAKFLPGLLSCDGWKMEADIQRGRVGMFKLVLSARDGLHAPVPTPEEFDSDVERKFAEKWGAAPREGWTLERESEPLIQGQHLFFPDFVFRHESGHAVFTEIIGYWTDEYLAEKRRTLERFQDKHLLLILRESTASKFTDLPLQTVTYKNGIKLEPVLAALATVK
jgi:predicted nuclease of restriction endonuclease-like RecB superfamily